MPQHIIEIVAWRSNSIAYLQPRLDVRSHCTHEPSLGASMSQHPAQTEQHTAHTLADQPVGLHDVDRMCEAPFSIRKFRDGGLVDGGFAFQHIQKILCTPGGYAPCASSPPRSGHKASLRRKRKALPVSAPTQMPPPSTPLLPPRPGPCPPPQVEALEERRNITKHSVAKPQPCKSAT